MKKAQNLPQKLFVEFMERFNNYSDEDIITVFNREVGCTGWGTARASFLVALHEQLNNRKINYSEIGDKRSYSLANKVKLIGNY